MPRESPVVLAHFVAGLFDLRPLFLAADHSVFDHVSSPLYFFD